MDNNSGLSMSTDGLKGDDDFDDFVDSYGLSHEELVTILYVFVKNSCILFSIKTKSFIIFPFIYILFMFKQRYWFHKRGGKEFENDVKTEFAEYQKEQRGLQPNQQIPFGLHEVWQAQAAAFYGGMMPGFAPNMQFLPPPMQFQNMFPKGKVKSNLQYYANIMLNIFF